MTTTEAIKQNKIQDSFKEVFSKEFGSLYVLEDKQILICEANRDYLTIDEFKEIFNATVPLIEEFKIEKFIFDKQNMRVFHQPSMEWYYVHWKKAMYEKGLKVHRKILPQNQPQFNMAVEAGKSQIRMKHPDLIVDKLDMQYRNSIEEAIEN